MKWAGKCIRWAFSVCLVAIAYTETGVATAVLLALLVLRAELDGWLSDKRYETVSAIVNLLTKRAAP